MSRTLRRVLLVTGVGAFLGGVAWWGTWHVVYGDNLRSVTLQVQDAPGAKPRTMELRLAPKLPTSRHANYVTLGGIIRTNVPGAVDSTEKYLPILRHEAWHGHQQAGWPYWGLWLAWYGLSSGFRNNQEAGARLHERMAWPRITVKGESR